VKSSALIRGLCGLTDSIPFSISVSHLLHTILSHFSFSSAILFSSNFFWFNQRALGASSVADAVERAYRDEVAAMKFKLNLWEEYAGGGEEYTHED